MLDSVITSYSIHYTKLYDLWNFETLELIKLGETVTLTPKERKILNYMFSHLGKLITYRNNFV